MKLTKLREGPACPDGRTCPAVHQTETGSLVIIGRVVTDASALSQMAIGPGEIAVEVPAGLLPEVSGCAGLLNEAELGSLLDRAERELFRLEVLDSYDVSTDGGDFARYVAGEPGPNMARKGPWLQRLREDAERGLHNSRVHVVRSPLSEYLRYEMEWGYLPNSGAGEDIRILDTAETAAPSGLPDHDFWLMDDRTAVIMRYDEGRRFLGAQVAPRWRLTLYRRAAAAVWQAAVPFAEYWAAHPHCQRTEA